jgi:N-acetylglucosamine-6-phosphate deacetylase
VSHLAGRDPVTGKVLRVEIDGGLISGITEIAGQAEHWIAPGLIDLQVNGYNGFDVNEPGLRPETVAGLARALARAGVTSFVPTLITAPADQLLASLATIARARDSAGDVAHAIPHVHVEGPFLSDQDGPRGVHDARHIRPPDVAEVRSWQRASHGLVGMVTMSPHWPDSETFVRAVAALGIRVAIGHTHATGEQVHRAVAAGATVSTHLGNGAHAMLPRHPNYVWAQLADDNLRVGLIADGHHLPADTFTAMVRAVGLDRAHLVSDATALAGMPPGRYRTPVGDAVELSPDGRLSHVGTSYLAGSARSLNECAAIATGLGGLRLGQVLALAARNPGRLLPGGGPARGVLTVGAVADLMTFAFEPGQRALRVETVLARGAGTGNGR